MNAIIINPTALLVLFAGFVGIVFLAARSPALKPPLGTKVAQIRRV